MLLSGSISKTVSNLIQTEMFFWWLDYVLNIDILNMKTEMILQQNRYGTMLFLYVKMTLIQ